MKYRTRYIGNYRRRRKTGVRRTGACTAGIICLAAVLYLALAAGTGAWMHEKLFPVPTQNTDQTPAEDEETDAQAEARPEKNVHVITETVAFPALESYVLAVKTDEEHAQESAQICKSRGGAGYIYKEEDAQYILYAAYESSAECGSVAQKLIEEEGIEAEVLPVCAEALEMRLTAPAMRIDGIRDVFSAWQQTVQNLFCLWQDLDGGRASKEQVLVRMRDHAERLEKECESAFADTLIQGQTDALDRLCSVVESLISQLNALCDDPPENILEVSAQIKYTGIGALTEYQSYIRALKTELT